MASLDGSPTTVELAPGYRLRAPGLQGNAEIRGSREPGTRDGGAEVATPALDDALAASGMNELQSIVIEAARVPIPDAQQVRTATGEEGLVLEVPDLGATVGQVVMAIDEDGTISWHYPQDQSGGIETSATRGAGATKTFVIRSTTPEVSGDDPGTRSPTPCCRPRPASSHESGRRRTAHTTSVGSGLRTIGRPPAQP